MGYPQHYQPLSDALKPVGLAPPHNHRLQECDGDKHLVADHQNSTDYALTRKPVGTPTQDHYEFQSRMLNLCAQFYGAAEELVKGAPSFLVAQCRQMDPTSGKLDPSTMLNDAKHIFDALLRNPTDSILLQPALPLYPVIPTFCHPEPAADTSAQANTSTTPAPAAAAGIPTPTSSSMQFGPREPKDVILGKATELSPKQPGREKKRQREADELGPPAQSARPNPAISDSKRSSYTPMPSNITSSRNEPHNSQTPCIARDEPTPASPEWKRPCHKPEDRSGAPASRLMLPTVAAVSPALLPSVPGESFAKFYRPRPAKAAPAPQCLLHPPFTDLPDGVVLPEGMNYSVMHHHPNWVLDVNDYIALDRKRKGTVPYPRDLQAPPLKLRTKLGHLQIRCTFCVKSYAGANASSLWKRHVREKHNILLKRRYLAPRPKERCKFLGND